MLQSPFSPEEAGLERLNYLCNVTKLESIWTEILVSFWPKAWLHETVVHTPTAYTPLSTPATPAQLLLTVKCLEHKGHFRNFVPLNNFHELLFMLSSFAHFTQITSHFRLESVQIKEHAPHNTPFGTATHHPVSLTTCMHWYTVEAAQFLFLKKISFKKNIISKKYMLLKNI